MPDEKEELMLVCATQPTQPNSLEAVCATCGATVYGTRGSVERASVEHYKIICEDCFGELENPQIAGVMHHGKMLNQGEIQSFVESWFARMARHGRN
jgi:hypothetical protein